MQNLLHFLDNQVEKIEQAKHLGRLCTVCDRLLIDDIAEYEGDPMHYECFEGLCEPDDHEPDWDLIIKGEKVC